MRDSFDILKFLKSKNLLENSPKLWWPNAGTEKIIWTAILTQRTKWENVEKSMKNLEENKIDDMFSISQVSTIELANFIQPSGFKNQKSKRLKQLAINIIEDYQDFNTFQKNVTRQWLLSQKGIGEESADGILCYCCLQDEMVVDNYTYKLLKEFDFELEEYDEIKDFIVYGVEKNYTKICDLYGYEIGLNEIYARFHGKIVEYMKNK
jgi:endonuclease-3 related protein